MLVYTSLYSSHGYTNQRLSAITHQVLLFLFVLAHLHNSVKLTNIFLEGAWSQCNNYYCMLSWPELVYSSTESFLQRKRERCDCWLPVHACFSVWLAPKKCAWAQGLHSIFIPFRTKMRLLQGVYQEGLGPGCSRKKYFWGWYFTNDEKWWKSNLMTWNQCYSHICLL